MELTAQFVLREASHDDIDALVSLINRAFAVESFVVKGDRINPELARQMMQEGRFLLLYAGAKLVACAFVKVTGERGYLGTLSVDPARQRAGIGSRMMRGAEDYLRAAGCKVVDIRIINLRTELPSIYRKYGFVETGEQPAAVITNAIQPIHFIIMSKEL